MEELQQHGDLIGAEIFLFTDNSVAESAFYKGTSESKILFDLVLRLRLLEHEHAMKIWIIHVAGTRMIEQGTDAISRGDVDQGVMLGGDILRFVPLHLSVVQRSPNIVNWVKSWCSEIICLDPEDWFERAHNIKSYIKIQLD